MKERIRQHIDRQVKGMQLLHDLLAEEYALLRERRPEDVSAVEFSIHELMRQLAAERESTIYLLHGYSLEEFVDEQPEDERAPFVFMVAELKRLEGLCTRQASMNSELALALYDQSRQLLEYLHGQIAPKENQNTYSARGGYARANRPQAALIRGRL